MLIVNYLFDAKVAKRGESAKGKGEYFFQEITQELLRRHSPPVYRDFRSPIRGEPKGEGTT